MQIFCCSLDAMSNDIEALFVIFARDLKLIFMKHRVKYVVLLALLLFTYVSGYSQTLYKVVVSTALNIRSEASVNAPVINQLASGSEVLVYSITDGWAKINVGNRVGYISQKYIQKVEVQVSEEPVEVTEEVVVEVVSENASKQKNKRKFELPNLPDQIYAKPLLHDQRFKLFASARMGLGGSSYAWKDGHVNGKVAFNLDAVLQCYLPQGLVFLPKNWYAEATLGYAIKGAYSFPMHYLDMHVMPLGYCYEFQKFNVLGKFGIYTGVPLSKLKYINASNVDVGMSIGAAVEYKLLSLGLAFDRGFVNVSPSSVKLHNWGLMLQLTCKLVAFNL